jgi:hypothetical protein
MSISPSTGRQVPGPRQRRTRSGPLTGRCSLFGVPLEASPKAGRQAGVTGQAAYGAQAAALDGAAAAVGRHSRGGTAGRGIGHREGDVAARGRGDSAPFWRALSSGPCLATVARPALAPAEPRAPRPRAGRGRPCARAAPPLAASQKKPSSIRLTSSSSMRVAFACRRLGAAPGPRAARRLSRSAGSVTPGSPWGALSPARRDVDAWDAPSASTPTIFARPTSSPSCASSSAKCTAPCCWCSSAGAGLGPPWRTWGPSGPRGWGTCRGCPLMRPHLIRWSRLGILRRLGSWPIICRRTWRRYTRRLASLWPVPASSKRGCGPVFGMPNSNCESFL